MCVCHITILPVFLINLWINVAFACTTLILAKRVHLCSAVHQATRPQGVFFIKRLMSHYNRMHLVHQVCGVLEANLHRWVHTACFDAATKRLIDHQSLLCAEELAKAFQHLSFLWEGPFSIALNLRFPRRFEEESPAKYEHFADSKYLYGQLDSVLLRLQPTSHVQTLLSFPSINSLNYIPVVLRWRI